MRKSIRTVPVIILALILSAGCATTRNEKFAELDQHMDAADYKAAQELLEDEDVRDNLYNPSKDKVLYYLDVGAVEFYSGDNDAAVEHLTEAEDLIKEYYTKSVSQAAGSYITNDNVVEYAGEDYEDIYLNAIKALAFADENDLDGAYVEMRRMNDKLNLLEDKFRTLAEQYNRSEDSTVQIELEENPFYSSALARYLSMVIYRADGDWDGARIDRDAIAEAFQTQAQLYPFPQPDLSDALNSVDGARISIVGLAGQAPRKRADTMIIRTLPGSVAVYTSKEGSDGNEREEKLDTIPWPGMEDGLFFKFQLPYMEKRGTEAVSARVYVDDAAVGELQLLESMEDIAYSIFEVKKPLIYTKTLTRTIVKGVAAYAAKKVAEDQAAKQGGAAAGMLAGILVGAGSSAAIGASEQADLRSSRFFPSHAFIGEFVVEPGEHTVRIDYVDAGGDVISRETVSSRNYRPGGLNLVSTYTPE